jgi:tetratricopeptide (TPR) repeat protein
MSQADIDTAVHVFQTTPNDSLRLEALNALSHNLTTIDVHKAEYYGKLGLRISDSLTRSGSKTISHSRAGRSRAIFHLILGNIYDSEGDMPKSLQSYLAALRIGEESGDPKIQYYAHNNIALVYQRQDNLEEALKENYIALDIKIKMKEVESLVVYSYFNIGSILQQQGKFNAALDNYLKGIKPLEKAKDLYALPEGYNDIASVYFALGNYTLALDYALRSKKICMEANDNEALSTCYHILGDIYLKKDRADEAKKYFTSSVELATKLGNRAIVKDGYLGLASVYEKIKDFKKAYDYHLLFTALKDSLLNDNNNRHIAQMNAQFESEKKDNQIKLLNKDNEKQAALAAAESRKQQVIIWSVLAGLVMLAIFSVLLLNRFRLIREQKKIIEDQKLIVEEKNKSITDSINYAGRIQRSLLPSVKYIDKSLNKASQKIT